MPQTPPETIRSRSVRPVGFPALKRIARDRRCRGALLLSALSLVGVLQFRTAAQEWAVIIGEGIATLALIAASLLSQTATRASQAGLSGSQAAAEGPLRRWLSRLLPIAAMATPVMTRFVLGLIGLKTAGIVVDSSATLLTMGSFAEPSALLAAVYFLMIAVLSHRNVFGAILLSMLVVTGIGWALGLVEYNGLVSMPPSLAPTWLAMDIAGALNVAMVSVILAFLFVNMFDTAGTLMGVAHRANLVNEDGKIENLSRALKADSSSSVVGAFVGGPPVTSYVESAAGGAAGGRTFGVIPMHLVAREIGKRDLDAYVVTETMHERKKVMFMNADAIVMLPGGAGSLDEFFEALTWRQLGLHVKPILLLVDHLLELLLRVRILNPLIEPCSRRAFCVDCRHINPAGATGPVLRSIGHAPWVVGQFSP